MDNNMIGTVKIKQIIEECEGIKTFKINVKQAFDNFNVPKPGQFTMVWAPGIDEVPMSISGYDEDGTLYITIKKVGDCTKALHSFEVGDFIGIRGTLGNSFTIPETLPDNIFLIAGGFGTAPLKFLSNELIKKDVNFTLIQGARESSQILFKEDLESRSNEGSQVFFCTEDGSLGEKGLVTDTFKKKIDQIPKDELSNSLVYTCGPEKMMYEVFKICQEYSLELQASLERIMRCGCGLCGLCALDPVGLLVCTDGPVFSNKELNEIEDFGTNKRDFSGRKTDL
jgi:dihydroorotate dehydrogenase electron transfer subunit